MERFMRTPKTTIQARKPSSGVSESERVVDGNGPSLRASSTSPTTFSSDADALTVSFSSKLPELGFGLSMARSR